MKRTGLRIIPFVVVMSLVLLSPALLAALKYEGSSTIGEGIMKEASVQFKRDTGIAIEPIGLLGSGKGFLAVMEQGADLGGLSRPLKDTEKQKGIYYQIIGYDAIVVYVNDANPVKSLSRTAVKKIFTGAVKNWREVGGENRPIIVVTEILTGKRATIEEFKELALNGEDYGPTKEIDKPADGVAFVAAHRDAITFASMSFATQGAAIVAYDGMMPSFEHVTSGAYPLSRPLVMISRKYPTGDLRRFFDFILSPRGQAIVGKKFVPMRKQP